MTSIPNNEQKTQLSLKQVGQRIKGLDNETRRRVVCALVGHSKIQTTLFGYYYCGRCGEQVGDSLGGVYRGAESAVVVGHGGESAVVVGHDCATCRANFDALGWQDTFLAPDPFTIIGAKQ